MLFINISHEHVTKFYKSFIIEDLCDGVSPDVNNVINFFLNILMLLFFPP